MQVKNRLYIKHRHSHLTNIFKEFEPGDRKFRMALSNKMICLIVNGTRDVSLINSLGETNKLSYIFNSKWYQSGSYDKLVKEEYIVNDWFLLEIIY